jgi:hypothetical protein
MSLLFFMASSSDPFGEPRLAPDAYMRVEVSVTFLVIGLNVVMLGALVVHFFLKAYQKKKQSHELKKAVAVLKADPSFTLCAEVASDPDPIFPPKRSSKVAPMSSSVEECESSEEKRCEGHQAAARESKRRGQHVEAKGSELLLERHHEGDEEGKGTMRPVAQHEGNEEVVRGVALAVDAAHAHHGHQSVEPGAQVVRMEGGSELKPAAAESSDSLLELGVQRMEDSCLAQLEASFRAEGHGEEGIRDSQRTDSSTLGSATAVEEQLKALVGTKSTEKKKEHRRRRHKNGHRRRHRHR